jgi:CspA family cold shock protein
VLLPKSKFTGTVQEEKAVVACSIFVEVSKMQRGRVKWFNEQKGYGFIQQENGEDVFVHYTAIEDEGYKTLAENQEVEFEVVRGQKGLQATKVRKL